MPLFFGANSANNSVSVIDTVAKAVVATIPMVTANGIAVAPNGKYAYVTGWSPSGTVSMIDTATNALGGDSDSGRAHPRSNRFYPIREARLYRKH
jgi:YVTN family beta-propeller protein